MEIADLTPQIMILATFTSFAVSSLVMSWAGGRPYELEKKHVLSNIERSQYRSAITGVVATKNQWIRFYSSPHLAGSYKLSKTKVESLIKDKTLLLQRKT